MLGHARILTLAALLLLAALAGCGGGDNGGPNNPDPQIDGTVVFTLGSQLRTFASAVAVYSLSDQSMNVSAGDNPASEGVLVVFPRVVGTVTLAADDDYGFTIVFEGELFTARDGVSSITVTELTSTRVKGTFSGVVANFLGEEYTVTDGSFDSDFVEIP